MKTHRILDCLGHWIVVCQQIPVNYTRRKQRVIANHIQALITCCIMGGHALNLGSVCQSNASTAFARDWLLENSATLTLTVMRSCIVHNLTSGRGPPHARNLNSSIKFVIIRMNVSFRTFVGTQLLPTVLKTFRNAFHCTAKTTECSSAGKATPLFLPLTIWNQMEGTAKVG